MCAWPRMFRPAKHELPAESARVTCARFAADLSRGNSGRAERVPASCAQRGQTVHETRKHLKKLRAALDLVASEVGKQRYAREDKCVRQISKLVSDLRDAHVRLQTLIELREHDTKRFSQLENLLSIERESFSAAFEGWQKQAIPKLEALQERLAAWPLEDLAWKTVCLPRPRNPTAAAATRSPRALKNRRGLYACRGAWK